MSLLKVRGLVKSYGRRRVVDGVDFEVDPGEIVGLLGSQRRRQDDHVPHGLRHDRSRRRPRHARRQGRHQLADVSPRERRRHGLPGPGIERLSQALGAKESARRDGNARHESQARATAAAEQLLEQFGITQAAAQQGDVALRRRAAAAGNRPLRSFPIRKSFCSTSRSRASTR